MLRRALTARFLLGFIAPVAASIGLLWLAAFGLVLPEVRQTLLENRRQAVHQKVVDARRLIDALAEQAGDEAPEVARRQVLEHVRRLYARGHSADYVWIHTLDGQVLLHPRQDLEGTPDASTDAGAQALRVVAKSNQLVRSQSEGFVEYDWVRPGTGHTGRKISYVQMYAPWGWVVGSGLYVDDIQAEVSSLTWKLAAVLGAGVVLAALLGVLVVASSLRAERRRVQSQKALQESEEKYRMLADGASEGIALIVDDRLEYANPALLAMLGMRWDELSSRRVSETLLRDEQGRQAVLHRRGEEGVSGGFEARLQRADGEWIDVILSPSLVHFQGADSIILAITEITQQKRDQHERDMLRQQYLQSQKMEAIGRLAGGIAHDFRNQLTVINGYTSLLLRKAMPGSPVRRPLEQILKSTARSGRLANQLLAFSRKQPVEPVPVSLNEIVRDMADSLATIIGEDIRLHIDLDSGIGMVLIDDGQAEQALMNLVVNARDAMPEGGELRVSTATVWIDGQNDDARPHEAGARCCVMLSVGDTGTGMDEQTRQQIFEPFFTTKEEGKGTGLGLAMVYGFVNQSGGSIRVESQPGQGSTFRLLLPTASAPAPSQADQPMQLQPGKHVTGTILVAEDDEAVRHLIVGVLRSRGHHVIEAGDGRQALPLGEHYDGPIDLLLTDIVMPGMDGIQLALRMQESRPELKLLFITGYTDRTDDLTHLVEAGADLLVKPFSPDALVRAVGQLLSRGPAIEAGFTSIRIDGVLRDE